MKHTSKYGFKLPESTDIYNVEDTNDNTRSIEEVLSEIQDTAENALQSDGDTQDNTVTFPSIDTINPQSWCDIPVFSSGRQHSTLFNHISALFNNMRWLYKRIGKDVLDFGNGTLTSAILDLDYRKMSCVDGISPGKDGRFYRFSNGLLICVQTIYVETAINNPWGLMYESSEVQLGSWVHEFASDPYVTISSNMNSAYAVGFNCLIEGLWGSDRKNIGSTQLMRPVSTDVQTYCLDVIGIGKWK